MIPGAQRSNDYQKGSFGVKKFEMVYKRASNSNDRDSATYLKPHQRNPSDVGYYNITMMPEIHKNYSNTLSLRVRDYKNIYQGRVDENEEIVYGIRDKLFLGGLNPKMFSENFLEQLSKSACNNQNYTSNEFLQKLQSKIYYI